MSYVAEHLLGCCCCYHHRGKEVRNSNKAVEENAEEKTDYIKNTNNRYAPLCEGNDTARNDDEHCQEYEYITPINSTRNAL